MIVTRVERHIIAGSEQLEEICLKSKNLYNRANYEIRQKFFRTSAESETGQREHAEWLRYGELDKICKEQNWQEYRDLPAQTSQQILKLLDKNWTSFFQAMKTWKDNPSKFKDRPGPPKYIRNGRNIVIFTNQQIRIKDGYIHFPEKAALNPVKTKVRNIRQVRIVPGFACHVVEAVYETETSPNENLNGSLYLGIDTGLNNLAAITSNAGLTPVLISGQPVKSINQFYNKRKAELQSFTGDKGTSRRIEKLTLKRSCKIDDYLHKSSRFIVDYAEQHGIGSIVIGKNDGWKQEISLGRRNNQNFVSVPFEKLIKQVRYKAEEKGINVVLTEESYTSKCSFFDGEEIGKHEEYKGKRVKRGLFRTLAGKFVNADVNGSLNIIRKAVPEAFADGIEALGLMPVRICFS